MDAVIILFTLLVWASLCAAVVGLIKPSLVRVGSRGKALGVYCGLAFLFMVAAAVVVPKPEKTESAQSMQGQSIQVTLDDHTGKSAANNNPRHDDVSQAVDYKIVKKGDVSFAGRKRIKIFIVADQLNLTYEQKAQTAMRAALDIQKETRANFVSAILEMVPEASGYGFALAMADYSPDNGGVSGNDKQTWKVDSSHENPTETDLQVMKAWYQNRDRFQKDGMTDEPKLKAFIASQIGLKPNQVSLPWISREAYFEL